MKNPIIENRLAVDETFAIRLLSFALSITCNDAYSEDEKKGLVSHATKLLEFQLATAIDQHEIDYLKRCEAEKKLKKGVEFLR